MLSYTWVFNTSFFGPAGHRRVLGSGRPRLLPKTIPEGGGGGAEHPTFRIVFGAAGAAKTLNNADFRTAQKPCVQKPECVGGLGLPGASKGFP